MIKRKIQSKILSAFQEPWFDHERLDQRNATRYYDKCMRAEGVLLLI